MSLTLTEVEHIANLARLNLTEEEKAKYRQQLSSILDYVTMLQELDTSAIPPTSGVAPDQCPLRADLPLESIPTVELLKNAPEAAKNQFKVPPVFE
jgi:aspartyl-tRNA(Asn)/glutamyl-tRNA(Gln) amidotransferase subunit C